MSCPRPHSRSRTLGRGDWEDLGFKTQLLWGPNSLFLPAGQADLRLKIEALGFG